jgi:hypothetical protein
MRSLSIPLRSAPNSIKILAAGALVAASATGYVLAGASAADAWTAVARSDAQFWCADENGCNAAGLGHVPYGVNSAMADRDGRIGQWERTVAISCKFPLHPDSSSQEGGVYTVEVRDADWSGRWEVNRYFMDMEKQPFDDSIFPNCSGSPRQNEGVVDVGPTNPT